MSYVNQTALSKGYIYIYKFNNIKIVLRLSIFQSMYYLKYLNFIKMAYITLALFFFK